MPIRRVHHVAYRCIDAKETVEWSKTTRAPRHAAWMRNGSWGTQQ
jgi:hypothetical protein